jgi:hypothetical protein
MSTGRCPDDVGTRQQRRRSSSSSSENDRDGTSSLYRATEVWLDELETVADRLDVSSQRIQQQFRRVDHTRGTTTAPVATDHRRPCQENGDGTTILAVVVVEWWTTVTMTTTMMKGTYRTLSTSYDGYEKFPSPWQKSTNRVMYYVNDGNKYYQL